MKGQTLRASRPLLAVIFVAAAAGAAYAIWGLPHRHAEPVPAEQPAQDGQPKPADRQPTEFDLLRISHEGSGVVAGSAEPGTFVEVRDGSTSIGKARAGDDGGWEFVLNKAMTPGVHVLGLVTANPAGGETESDRVAVVAVPEVPADRRDESDGVVVLLAPRNSAGPNQVVQRPGPVKAKQDLGLDSVDYHDDTALLSGFAPPDVRLRLYLDDAYLDVTDSSGKGRWTLGVTRSFGSGRHRLRIDQVDDDGTVTKRVEQEMDPAPSFQPPKDADAGLMREEHCWELVRQLPGGSAVYTQVYPLDAAKAADTAKIYPGQRFERDRPGKKPPTP
ncbi:MAG: hypothetical protein GC201_15395 [Alphaproteobacteria bacterium]|nr:hypothetical protein [Alphaproteobacteria bacterium]